MISQQEKVNKTVTKSFEDKEWVRNLFKNKLANFGKKIKIPC